MLNTCLKRSNCVGKKGETINPMKMRTHILHPRVAYYINEDVLGSSVDKKIEGRTER